MSVFADQAARNMQSAFADSREVGKWGHRFWGQRAGAPKYAPTVSPAATCRVVLRWPMKKAGSPVFAGIPAFFVPLRAVVWWSQGGSNS